MKNKNGKKRSGFSLIELIFAIFFVSFIIFGVIKLQTSNLTLSNTQNNALKAHLLANQGAEIVNVIGKTPIGLIYPTCALPCEKKISLNVASYELVDLGAGPELIDGLFERTILITDAGLTDAYKVTSVIEWTDSSGDHRRKVDGQAVNGQVEAKRIVYQ